MTDLDDALEKGRTMVALLEQGQTDAAVNLLDDLTRLRERELFQELGHLARHLHESLKAVRLSDEVSELTDEIPDARQRLGYVVRLTEKAAHRTLSAVEDLTRQAESTRTQANELLEAMETLGLDDRAVPGLTSFQKQLQHSLELLSNSKAHDSLTEIMMAQGYQDIAGQIIQRVIQLAEELESGLINILRKSSDPLASTHNRHTAHIDRYKGPAVPGLTGDDRLDNQDDVDQLLQEYGF